MKKKKKDISIGDYTGKQLVDILDWAYFMSVDGWKSMLNTIDRVLLWAIISFVISIVAFIRTL